MNLNIDEFDDVIKAVMKTVDEVLGVTMSDNDKEIRYRQLKARLRSKLAYLQD